MNERSHISEIDALRRDAARFVELVRICPNGVVVCKSGNVTFANPAFERIVKTPAESIVGRQLSQVVDPGVRESTLARLEAMLNQAVGHTAVFATRLIRSDGAVVDVDVSIEQLEMDRTADSVVVFRPVPIFRDSQLMCREDLLQRTHTLRMSVFGELAASLVHELGQPVTAAKGASELLIDDDGTIGFPRDNDKLARILVGSISGITDKFQNIWNFVRLRKPDLRSVGINSVIEDAIDLVSSGARHAGVRISFSAADVETATVDASLIELATISLLRRSITALTATVGEDRLIEVRTYFASNGFVAAEILHNGIGMSAEELSDSNLLVEESSTEHLALATCRMIIEENHGVLVVQPREGGGVRYQVLIPV